MGFVDNLGYLLKLYNLTQSHLAEEIGLNPYVIRSWFFDTSSPTEEQQRRVVKFFEPSTEVVVTLEWLNSDNQLDQTKKIKTNPFDWKPNLPQPKKKSCLKCSRRFLSKDKTNRICDTCKKNLSSVNDVLDRYQFHLIPGR